MLGIRLDATTEAALRRVARRSGRTKSDVARDAIQAYLDRNDADGDFAREVAMIAALTGDADLTRMDEANDDLLELIEEEERTLANRPAA